VNVIVVPAARGDAAPGRKPDTTQPAGGLIQYVLTKKESYELVDPVSRAHTPICRLPAAYLLLSSCHVVPIPYARTEVHEPPGGSSQNWYCGMAQPVDDAVNVISEPCDWGGVAPGLRPAAMQPATPSVNEVIPNASYELAEPGCRAHTPTWYVPGERAIVFHVHAAAP
jgi:hypothetical protein